MKNPDGSRGKALLSIHDISPGRLPAVREMLADLKSLGLTALNLAVVPAFHQAEPWRRSEELGAMLETVQAHFRTEILLHGYYHQRFGSNETLPWRSRLRSRLQSADEDEFYRLNVGEAKDRISKGLTVLAEAFKSPPDGFIPPSWALTKDMLSMLNGLGFSYTEDHFHIFDLRSGRKTPSPVIAFSSRSGLHRNLSLLWSWWASKRVSRKRILRVALHPEDYRSPRIQATALDLIKKTGAERDWCLYRDVFPANPQEPLERNISFIDQKATRSEKR